MEISNKTLSQFRMRNKFDIFPDNQWNVRNWPAYTPEFSPLERLWVIVKKMIVITGNVVEDFEERVAEMWNWIDETTQKTCPGTIRNDCDNWRELKEQWWRTACNYNSFCNYWMVVSFGCVHHFLKLQCTKTETLIVYGVIM